MLVLWLNFNVLVFKSIEKILLVVDVLYLVEIVVLSCGTKNHFIKIFFKKKNTRKVVLWLNAKLKLKLKTTIFYLKLKP